MLRSCIFMSLPQNSTQTTTTEDLRTHRKLILIPSSLTASFSDLEPFRSARTETLESKMHSTDHSHNFAKQSFQIKEDGKFFTRLLSKETSLANSSFRVLYYGGASGAVPFMWESQPGTPKHSFSETSLPPLTPPPSYYSKYSMSDSMKKSSKRNLLHTIFPKLSPRKALVSASSSLSSVSSSSLSSWSSSTYSSPPSFMKPKYHRSSSTSTLSFGARRKANSNRFRGCYPMGNMKNAFLSIVGHGSGHGTA
jgi:hypothetical protein